MLKITLNKAASEKLRRMLREAPDKVQNAVSVALFRCGNDMRNRAIDLSPYKTGNLRRSMTMQLGAKQVKVGTNLVYARIHDEGGTLPARTILSRNGRFLRFVVGGKVVFAKKVRQPARYQKPYKGRGYLTPAFNEMVKGDAQKIFSEEIEAVLK